MQLCPPHRPLFLSEKWLLHVVSPTPACPHLIVAFGDDAISWVTITDEALITSLLGGQVHVHVCVCLRREWITVVRVWSSNIVQFKATLVGHGRWISKEWMCDWVGSCSKRVNYGIVCVSLCTFMLKSIKWVYLCQGTWSCVNNISILCSVCVCVCVCRSHHLFMEPVCVYVCV